MKTKSVSLTGIALATQLMVGTGCRTTAPTQINEQSQSSHLQLPAGTVVRVRLPKAGRYYQALFQAPTPYEAQAAPSGDWTGASLHEDWFWKGIEYSQGFLLFPLVVGAVAHSLGGVALYHTVGKPTAYPQDDQARDVAAMASVSRAWDFEQELKEAVMGELRQCGLLAIAERDAPGGADADADAATITVDLYVVAAGMIRDQSFSKGVNPPQSLHVDVRAEVAGASIPPVTMRVTFDSKRVRFSEWAADGASRFAAVRAESIHTLASDLAGRLTASAQPALRFQAETHLAFQP